jgi:hypothetical protein
MQVHANGRVRRTRSEWQKICDRFEASGLSKSAFCRREGIAKASFAKWMARLADEQTPVAESAPFIELSPAVSEPTVPLFGCGELELLLPGGIRIRWKG